MISVIFSDMNMWTGIGLEIRKMKFKLIINYKSVRECHMFINPVMRKGFYGVMGIMLAISIVSYWFQNIVFAVGFFLGIFAIMMEYQWLIRRDSKMLMEKIEDLVHTNEIWGEIIFDESALKVIPYGNTELEYFMEYSRFKDFYILKHYCVFGDKRKIGKGLTQETLIIDKTDLTEADMNSLTSLIHEKMPQVKVHEKKQRIGNKNGER